jgi:hypothetical protein
LDQERNMGGLVTYLRVSTSQQGKSDLGIEAQREALARFAQAEGLDIVAEHLEVETGIRASTDLRSSLIAMPPSVSLYDYCYRREA